MSSALQASSRDFVRIFGQRKQLSAAASRISCCLPKEALVKVEVNSPLNPPSSRAVAAPAFSSFRRAAAVRWPALRSWRAPQGAAD